MEGWRPCYSNVFLGWKVTRFVFVTKLPCLIGRSYHVDWMNLHSGWWRSIVFLILLGGNLYVHHALWVKHGVSSTLLRNMWYFLLAVFKYPTTGFDLQSGECTYTYNCLIRGYTPIGDVKVCYILYSWWLPHTGIISLKPGDMIGGLTTSEFITHRIHGAAIYGNIYHHHTPNVSIYTSTMHPMGNKRRPSISTSSCFAYLSSPPSPVNTWRIVPIMKWLETLGETLF